MTIAKKIMAGAGVLAAITAIGGSFVTATSYFAIAEETRIALDSKVDKLDFKTLQVHLMEDKLEELEIQEFEIESKPSPHRTELDAYRLKRIKGRIEKVKRHLEAFAK